MDRVARPLLRRQSRQRGQLSMSARQVEARVSAVHPRETTALFGHNHAEMALLNAYRSGRVPHAWLIGGPAGIGKATLAYRMARFVLAHRNPLGADVQGAESLRVAGNFDEGFCTGPEQKVVNDSLVLQRQRSEFMR